MRIVSDSQSGRLCYSPWTEFNVTVPPLSLKENNTAMMYGLHGLELVTKHSGSSPLTPMRVPTENSMTGDRPNAWRKNKTSVEYHLFPSTCRIRGKLTDKHFFVVTSRFYFPFCGNKLVHTTRGSSSLSTRELLY